MCRWASSHFGWTKSIHFSQGYGNNATFAYALDLLLFELHQHSLV